MPRSDGATDGSPLVRGVTATSRQSDAAPGRWQLAAGALALVAAAALLTARIAINARLAPWLAASMAEIRLLATLGPALAVLVIAATTGDDLERVGLAFVGAFGLLAAAASGAAVPAAAAIAGGGGLAVGSRWHRSGDGFDWHLAPVVLLVAAVAVSLAGGIGIASTTLSPAGTHLALLGAATTPVLLVHRAADWAFGGAVAAVLFGIGAAAPFVTGAVALIGGGAVGASLLVLGAGLCGLVTTASAALRQHRWHALAGSLLLVVGGIPATIPRALAVVLGITLLVDTRQRGAGHAG